MSDLIDAPTDRQPKPDRAKGEDESVDARTLTGENGINFNGRIVLKCEFLMERFTVTIDNFARVLVEIFMVFRTVYRNLWRFE